MKRIAEEIFQDLIQKKNYEYDLPKNIKKLGSRVIAITAPPGAGKTSCINGIFLMNFFINKIFEKLKLSEPKFVYAPGSTTRHIREGEKHGYDFNFLSTKQFLSQLENRDFVLYFTSSPYLYAVDGWDIERRLSLSDESTVFVYNLNAFQIPKLKKKLGNRLKTIFINASSVKELEDRKFKRGGLSPAEIAFRKRTMLLEIEQGKRIADIQIINRDFPQTVYKILHFIINKVIAKNANIPAQTLQKINRALRLEINQNQTKLLELIGIVPSTIEVKPSPVQDKTRQPKIVIKKAEMIPLQSRQ